MAMNQATKQSLKGSTVLVTGGAGLIGSHIVDRLIDRGVGEIRVLDNLVRGRLENLKRAMAHRSIITVLPVLQRSIRCLLEICPRIVTRFRYRTRRLAVVAAALAPALGWKTTSTQ